MDTDAGKIFIGGISWETGEDRLKEYFSSFGEVVQTVIMRDRLTGRARGFGFVVFSDPAVVDRVVLEKHSIDGRSVEAKRAVPRSEQQNSKMNSYNNNHQSSSGGYMKTKKIFVGGLPANLTEESFRNYFQQFGSITDVVVMYDQNTQRPRGFGFITFDSEEAVESVLQKTFHQLGDKLVEVKRALPKDAVPAPGSRGSAGNYDNRMDNNRYGQGPTGRGGYPSYGPTGYGPPSYGPGGYGTSVNAGGYGYGNYGMGYGGAPAAAPGYGASAGGYGNAPVPSAGYGSGPAVPHRNQWGNSGAPAYGADSASAGYGANSSYGGSAPWTASAPPGQSPGSANGYGSANYGYGYPNNDSSYNNAGGYGGPRGGAAPNYSMSAPMNDQSVPGGPYGSGYSDSRVNPGYPENSWKSGGSDGHYAGPATGGYGVPQTDGVGNGPAGYGGYGGPGRQPQRQ